MNQETTWDNLLKVKTSGRDDTNADQYRYPYEPTSYSVLMRLANSGYIKKGDILLDYGCGRGRVEFFLNYQIGCRAIGIEYDERIYQKAIENCNTAVKSNKVEFQQIDATVYNVPESVTCIYFFNPFSKEILQRVMKRILESYYCNPRKIQLFFYYPSDEYISTLMMVDELEFLDEIDCRDLFDKKDSRERIMIFQLGNI